MTPEKRVAKIAKDYLLTADTGYEHNLKLDIARAIRAAENAALEEAARVADQPCGGKVCVPYGSSVLYVGRCIGDAIRSLKTRAPRARRKA